MGLPGPGSAFRPGYYGPTRLEGDIETIARTSISSFRFRKPFGMTWRSTIAGMRICRDGKCPKMQPGYFGSHMGFIADDIAELFHNELRP
jgi:hypothetical protein